MSSDFPISSSRLYPKSFSVCALTYSMVPPAPANVQKAANKLKYRDFLIVTLILKKKDLFPDNWIYIHSPEVNVGRIQNFRSWSPWMVPNDTDASIGMEYFCFEGDELWSMPDEDLVALATREIQQLGLARAEKVKIGNLVQLTVRLKAPTKEREGRNPSTGEVITIAPKPASVDVRARVLAKTKSALPSIETARRHLAA